MCTWQSCGATLWFLRAAFHSYDDVFVLYSAGGVRSSRAGWSRRSGAPPSGAGWRRMPFGRGASVIAIVEHTTKSRGKNTGHLSRERRPVSVLLTESETTAVFRPHSGGLAALSSIRGQSVVTGASNHCYRPVFVAEATLCHAAHMGTRISGNDSLPSESTSASTERLPRRRASVGRWIAISTEIHAWDLLSELEGAPTAAIHLPPNAERRSMDLHAP